MSNAPLPIILSVPTSGNGATAAATYSFLSSGYQPPRQQRFTTQDVNKNHNGIHKYRYDNGPGPYVWSPFELVLMDTPNGYVPSATQQWADLQFLWQYIEGPLQLGAPDGIYRVDWPEGLELERRFVTPHGAAGDKHEYRVTVGFEEG